MPSRTPLFSNVDLLSVRKNKNWEINRIGKGVLAETGVWTVVGGPTGVPSENYIRA